MKANFNNLKKISNQISGLRDLTESGFFEGFSESDKLKIQNDLEKAERSINSLANWFINK